MPKSSRKLPDGPQTFYTLTEMAMFLAERVRPPGEPVRSTIDKIRKRLLYAVGTGKMKSTMRLGETLYTLPDVVIWGLSKWPGKLLDLKGSESVTVQERTAVGEQWAMNVLPGDLPRCQDALKTAFDQIDQLGVELKAAHAEIALLKPLADKYKQNRDKNRRSAKLPRSGGL